MASNPYFVSKKVGKAIADYNMLKDKDRVLVALSGGKDSFTLLKILKERQSFVPINYELIVAHIVIDKKNAKVIEQYLKNNNYRFYIDKMVDKNSKPRRKNMKPCFWCAWNRREGLFKLASRLECTKIALAHHKDDIVQTQLMNLFFNGEISTMLPMQKMFNGRFHIIRPLAYVEEADIVRFFRENDFPRMPYTCPHSQHSNRAEVAKIIKKLERICPGIKHNIFRSLGRIKKDYLV